MKECDNSTRKVHISSNFILSISLLIMFDTLVLRPSLHCNTPLHFITHHHTLPKYISLHFTTRHPTRLHNIVFGLTGNYLSICSSGTLRSLVKLSIAHNHWLWTPGPLSSCPQPTTTDCGHLDPCQAVHSPQPLTVDTWTLVKLSTAHNHWLWTPGPLSSCP